MAYFHYMYALIILTSTQELAARKIVLANHNGRYTCLPRNSNLYAIDNHSAWAPAQTPAINKVSRTVRRKRGRINGKNHMYQIKYWDVQTLLKVTKIMVWANHAKGKPDVSRPNRKPVPIASVICGTKDNNGWDVNARSGDGPA